MKRNFWTTPGTLFALTCLVLGALGYLFLGYLVAEPKVLFGRSLTAITPTLFPSIVLFVLFVLCGVQLVLSYLHYRYDTHHDESDRIVGWTRGAVFFGTLTVYGLIMGTFGFIISSALTIAFLSWYIGNRSIVQIVLVSILAPILLYLAATRLLAVSLPELTVIQQTIAEVFNLFSADPPATDAEVSQ